MAIQRLDTLLAIKAFLVAPGLFDSDRRVGLALIEHYNRRTGQCDPGIERIAGLLDISVRTVLRATVRLRDQGYFEVIVHGGHLGRNSYEPIWDRYCDVNTAWDVRFRTRSRGADVTPLASPATRHGSPPSGDTGVIQTCVTNLFQGTYTRKRTGGEAKRTKPRPIRPHATLTPSHQAITRNRAEQRWNDELLACFRSTPLLYGDVIDKIDDPLREAATDFEMKKPGLGLAHILQRLGMPPRGPGTPS